MPKGKYDRKRRGSYNLSKGLQPNVEAELHLRLLAVKHKPFFPNSFFDAEPDLYGEEDSDQSKRVRGRSSYLQRLSREDPSHYFSIARKQLEGLSIPAHLQDILASERLPSILEPDISTSSIADQFPLPSRTRPSRRVATPDRIMSSKKSFTGPPTKPFQLVVDGVNPEGIVLGDVPDRVNEPLSSNGMNYHARSFKKGDAMGQNIFVP